MIGIWNNYGNGIEGCAGVPSLTLSGPPIIGNDTFINIGNDGAPTACGLFWSFSSADTFVPLIGGNLLVGAPFITVNSFQVPNGGLTIVCALGRNCNALGAELYLQSICIDECGPEGFSATPGLFLRIGDI